MSITYDINSEKWLSCWKLDSYNPKYHETLFKYFKSLCISIEEPELIKQLDLLIEEEIEKKLGADIQTVLYVYNNLPSLNSMTKSKNPEYPQEYVYKYTIKQWLDEVEKWIFGHLVAFEKKIIFQDAQKIM